MDPIAQLLSHPPSKIKAVELPYPESTLQRLENHPIDEVRNLRVAVIGAGLAGIIAGVLLPAKVPGIDLRIYEKNSDVVSLKVLFAKTDQFRAAVDHIIIYQGGTWLENIYPGVRCDIPANVYQSSFSPRTQWTEEYAQGAEILDYWQGIARKYDVYRYLHTERRVDRIEWDDEESVWHLAVQNVRTLETYQEQADFVLAATGRFNAWKLPDYPGIHDYQGLLRHSSNWDPEFDPTGKNVAVIGNGASGIQLVPSLQKVVNRLDHYARNKTWIAASWSGDVRTLEPKHYSPEQLEALQDPEYYLRFRKNLEDKYWRGFETMFKGSDLSNGMREEFTKIMATRLQKNIELLKNMVPDFSPHCRRLTPGPGYLEALCCENVDFIQNPIRRFTAHGIETVDGIVRDVDAIICATGANVDFAPAFSILSRGIDLKTAWKPDGEFGFPYTYLGLATPGFPNLLFVAGPHGSALDGTVPHSIENQITYCAKVLRKAANQRIKSMVPTVKATNDFLAYSDAFFPTTVLTESCSSWANGGRPGGRIHGLWPGSSSHMNVARREPRWEDWEYEYVSPSGNRFAYFGNGWTEKEMLDESDLTSYLKLPHEIDLRSLHESWLDL